ncbi:MAG: hypothetical protein RR585_12255 [Coprobacillus sp.]
MKYTYKFLRVSIGILLFALGNTLCIRANIGLSPWDAFSMGVAGSTGLSYGTIVQITGLFVLVFSYLLKEEIGVGTVLDILVIGKLTDIFLELNIVPVLHNFYLGIAVLFLSQFVMSIAYYVYIGTALGCGPRDSLMIALGKKFKKVPIGMIKGSIEATVLLIGFLLGAKVGLGTVISVFGIGFIMQFTFKLLKFDVTSIAHESLLSTFSSLIKRNETEEA